MKTGSYNCSICGACFDSLEKLRNHKQDCTKENPFVNDENAYEYNEEIIK